MFTKQQDMQRSQSIARSTIKCRKHNLSTLACFNQDCKLYPFVCSQENCQCQKDHEDCSLLVTSKLQKSVRKKIVTLKPLEHMIQTYFQQTIDKLSTYRDQLLLKLQKSYEEYFGLSKIEIEVLKAFDNQKYSQLNGQKFFLIQIHLKDRSQYAFNLQKKFEQIQKTLIKFEQETKIFNKNIENHIENLQKNFQLDSKIISTFEEKDIIQSFFENKKIKQFKLIYRGSENNFLFSIFLEKSENIDNTLIICRTQFGKIIGGYTPLFWRFNNQWLTDHSKDTFIFSLTNKHKFVCKNNYNQICAYHNQGIYFSQGCDLIIAEKANKKNCIANINTYFTNPNYLKNNIDSYKLFSGSQTANFKLQQWQVFKIQFDQ